MSLASTIQPISAASLFQPGPSGDDKKPQRFGCGSQEIDDALRGGVDPGFGGLSCITGEKGVGKTGLAFAFLVTHLLSSTTSQAVLIDATGTLNVLRLYNTVMSRLRRLPDGSNTTKEEDKEAAAAEILDRVKIMRVFDVLGMVEAVSEIRENLESQQRGLEREEKTHTKPAAARAEPQQQPQRQESNRKLQRIRGTIPDSDDEEDEDDVMLFDDIPELLEEEVRKEVPIVDAQRAEDITRSPEDNGRVGMIIVDNITHVVSPMMKTNYVQASALLTSFLRSLSQLTRSHNLSTILINAAINVPSIPPSKNQSPGRGGPHMKNPYASIFASAGHLQPALSPLLPSHVDLHLLITTQPLTRQDAATQQSFSKASSMQARSSSCESVSVIEVLSDRYANRIGRWAALCVNDAGIIEDVNAQRGTPRKEYRLPGFASKIIL